MCIVVHLSHMDIILIIIQTHPGICTFSVYMVNMLSAGLFLNSTSRFRVGESQPENTVLGRI